MKANEVWVPLGAVGFKSRTGTEFVVIRKLKRGGYSYRYVERLFSGYVHSTKTHRVQDWREFLEEVDAPVDFILGALERAEEKDLWQGELEATREFLSKKKAVEKRELPELRQTSLQGVFS